MKQKNNHGFTLVELMIVVAILGVITAVAIPAYDSYITKSRRADARIALTGIAQLQETYYTKRNTYTTKLTGADSVNCDQKGLCKVDGSNVLSSDGNYLLSVTSADNVGYTLSATIYGSKQEKDKTKCNVFTLNEKNIKASKDSDGHETTDCW